MRRAVTRCPISRVRISIPRIGSLCLVRGVFLAGVAHEDGPLLYRMALRAICGAHVDAVLVVEAPADRVPFDDEVAHLEGAWWRTRWCSSERSNGLDFEEGVVADRYENKQMKYDRLQ